MQLGGLLVAQGHVTPDEVGLALDRQEKEGGRLGENLVALGVLSQQDLDTVLDRIPEVPRKLSDTGIGVTSLQRLMLKSMLVDGFETPAELSDRLKLPFAIVATLLENATDKKLVEALGAAGIRANELRYGLSERGRHWAQDALNQNMYVGPAPVSLASFCQQTRRQRIANERIDRAGIEESFANLIMPEGLIGKLGPAVNAMKAMLLYGPPGNGKTTIAEKVGKMFRHVVAVPYAIEVDGQIIKVFDPSVHIVPDVDQVPRPKTAGGIVRETEFDQRWVGCHRPVIVTGGELSLEMLDLQFSHLSRFYEAPLHVKALNGTFIIDDFGRQIVRPQELLNRWIVPLESRIDYLKLHTGNSFSVPFDEFVIFSTNLTPDDLVDPAFLRRIPYKLEIPNPGPSDYKAVFQLVARGAGLELSDDAFAAVMDELTAKGISLAFYQPKFITEQVLAACKYQGVPPRYSSALVAEALENLYMRSMRKGAAPATSARM